MDFETHVEPTAACADDMRRLAERGFAIFPCRRRSKKPAINGWPQLASCDPAQIDAWAEDFVYCNWAIVTGPKSGFFVIDVDAKPDGDGKVAEDGFAALAAWSAEHPETADWLVTRSIRTAYGQQFLYRYPEGQEIHCSVGALAPGIDVRGMGGYIMAPPSRHPAGPIYEWANDEPIRPAPPWLFAKIMAARRGASTVQINQASDANPDFRIVRGCRNATLTSFAGSMRRRGMSQAAIEAALLVANREQCEVPLPEHEVANIAASVSRYEPERTELKADAEAPAHILKPEDIPDPRLLSRDPMRFLVDDIIPAGQVTVIAAEFSTGKTWLGLILAAAAKRGGTFIGRDVQRCDEVIVLDRENPLSIVGERMNTIYEEGEEAHRHWGMWCADEPPMLANPLLLDFACPGALLIFDALIRFHTASENSPTEMATVMGHLRRLQSRGATVVVFHHRDKKLEAGYRGTVEIPAGCDLLYSLAREEGNLVLRTVKSRLQVDPVITFRADWDNAALIPCDLGSVIEQRALIADIRDQIRRTPGISQSGIAKAVNATRVQSVSRYRIQRVLDKNEGSLWRAERGASGTSTRYFDLFAPREKKLLVGDGCKDHGQQAVGSRPAEPAGTMPAGLQPEKSVTSEKPAEPAAGDQQLFSHQPADLLLPYMGSSQQVGQQVRREGLVRTETGDDDDGVLV